MEPLEALNLQSLVFGGIWEGVILWVVPLPSNSGNEGLVWGFPTKNGMMGRGDTVSHLAVLDPEKKTV